MSKEDLFFTTRPNTFGDGPVEVHWKFYWADLFGIDSVKESANVYIFFAIYWKDDRLWMRDPEVEDDSAWDAYCFKPEVDPEKMWTPNIELVNQGEDSEIDVEAREVVNIPGHGVYIILHMQYKGDVSVDLDLRQFPFDRLTIPLKFRSATMCDLDVKMVLDPSRQSGNLMETCMDENVWDEEFAVRSMRCMVDTHNYPMIGELEGASHANFSEFRIELKLERNPGFVMNKVWIPFTFLTVMDFFCLMLLEYDIGNRNNISLTLFLTAVALKFSVSSFLPKISYQTRLDVYIIWIYAIMAFIYFQNFFVFILYGADTFLSVSMGGQVPTRYLTDSHLMQKVTLGIALAVYVMVNLWFVFPGFFYGKQFRVLNPYDVTEYMNKEAFSPNPEFDGVSSEAMDVPLKSL
eukprot:TRINITY_DN4123_c1_g1_i1.p1 TRINITY_DN4123_c1_g1~~TRINITY_DN4123_c1_g1_i1.p1  ORF type:complete len:428 (+),score=106.59 TRINITY_DN4123_c1_g1_i1:68-1285(+)